VLFGCHPFIAFRRLPSSGFFHPRHDRHLIFLPRALLCLHPSFPVHHPPTHTSYSGFHHPVPTAHLHIRPRRNLLLAQDKGRRGRKRWS
jgi:hypothetical protein